MIEHIQLWVQPMTKIQKLDVTVIFSRSGHDVKDKLGSRGINAPDPPKNRELAPSRSCWRLPD